MPYRPYPNRWRALDHLRCQQKIYTRGRRLRPVAPLTGAREQLFLKLQTRPDDLASQLPVAISRRIAKMTDQQVDSALARSDEDVAAARAKADDDFRYAPPTDDTPVRLWEHVDMA